MRASVLGAQARKSTRVTFMIKEKVSMKPGATQIQVAKKKATKQSTLALEVIRVFCQPGKFDSNVCASLKQVENVRMNESSEAIMQ